LEMARGVVGDAPKVLADCRLKLERADSCLPVGPSDVTEKDAGMEVRHAKNKLRLTFSNGTGMSNVQSWKRSGARRLIRKTQSLLDMPGASMCLEVSIQEVSLNKLTNALSLDDSICA